ncbi:PSMD4, partial [Symbiodinium sp. KB8]
MDTSDHMRNGDFEPTRLDAQQAAVRLLIDTRLSRGPENYVGLVTTGTAVKVRAPATDQEELLAESIRDLRAGGTADFVSAMKVARLALHNRTNKAGDARIVAFVGSPVTASAKELKRLASQLRGINIGVDVVLVGEDASTRASLEAFVQAVGKDRDNSCVVAVPPGRNLADALFSSPVTRGHDAGAAGAAAGGGGGGGGGGG